MSHVVVTTRCQVQHGKYFPNFSFFATSERNLKYEENMKKQEIYSKMSETGKTFLILNSTTCDNNFIAQSLLKSNLVSLMRNKTTRFKR